jgi:hypothetical protein
MTIDLPALVALHARLLLQAREAEALDYEDNPHRERERAEARKLRQEAAALGEVLEPHGVQIPHPRQLSLLADGRE